MVIKGGLGEKRVCPSCSVKFYDLGKNPATCPKCGHSFDPSVAVAKKRGRKKPADVIVVEEIKKPKKGRKEVEIEVEEDDGMEVPDADDADDLGDIETADDDLEEMDDFEDDEIADDESEEAIIEEMDEDEVAIIDSLEDELEEELEHEIEDELDDEMAEDEDDDSGRRKGKPAKPSKSQPAKKPAPKKRK